MFFWPLGIMIGGEPGHLNSTFIDTDDMMRSEFVHVKHIQSVFIKQWPLLRVRILCSVAGFGLLTFHSVFLLRQTCDQPFPSV